LVDVQERVDVAPAVIDAGLNDALQVGAGGLPVPVRFTVVSVPATPPVLDETVKLPLKVPLLVGANFIVMVHVAFAASERPFVQVVEVLLKGALGDVKAGFPSTRLPTPTFFTVIVVLTLLPEAIGPKS
jgi:hypothetical protein